VTAAELSTAASGAVNSGGPGDAQDVTRILASWPAPQMPARLVARLDQALAAEAGRSRAATRSPGPVGRPRRR
jgi:hypothetical protein